MFHSHGPSAVDHVHGAAEGHSHSHSHSASADVTADTAHAILNPHAAWFALASVFIKEWLYRLTARVASEEHSPVLKANALQYVPNLPSLFPLGKTDDSHRADALTSLVALTSILGSSFGGYTFLDPLGGLAVTFFILQQGLSLSKVAMLELLDAGVDKPTQKKIELLVEGLVDGKDLLGVRNVRGVKSGGMFLAFMLAQYSANIPGQTHLDLTISVPANMTVRDSHAVEWRVRDAIISARREVREVKIHVHGEGEDEGVPGVRGDTKEGSGVVTSDFGKEGC